MREAEFSRQVTQKALAAFPAREVTPATYASMKYPKLIPMMRFTCHQ